MTEGHPPLRLADPTDPGRGCGRRVNSPSLRRGARAPKETDGKFGGHPGHHSSTRFYAWKCEAKGTTHSILHLKKSLFIIYS